MTGKDKKLNYKQCYHIANLGFSLTRAAVVSSLCNCGKIDKHSAKRVYGCLLAGIINSNQ